jgi:hypothetical protein
MLYFRLGLVALTVFSIGLACSDDDSNGGGQSGSAGASASAGAGGRAGAFGSAGSSGSGMGGSPGSGEATYTVAETCERFAAASCAKAAECGLVLQEVANQLVCVDCNPTALQVIAGFCEGDLAGPKSQADVDRCLANTMAASCANTCAEADVVGCEVFDELEGDGEPVTCDPLCIAD